MMLYRSFHINAPLNKVLRSPKFDVKNIISNLSLYTDSVKKRALVNGPELLNSLQELPKLYNDWKLQNNELSKIQTERKKLELQLYKLKGISEQGSDKFSLISALQDYKQKTKLIISRINDLNSRIHGTCEDLPNLLDASVPFDGKPKIYKMINPLAAYVPDQTRDHLEIMTKHKNLVDFANGSLVTGTSFYYLINEGAELEYALIQYSLRKAKAHGFQICIPPSVARMEIINACGFRPRDMNNEQQIYKIEKNNTGDDADEQLGLIATAEITLAGLGINKVFTNLPLKKVGVTRSYRAEAGARGKDTRGLYRVHEFSKVELFCWCKPEDSSRILQDLRDLQIEIITELGLTAQVLNMPTNDLGAPAYQKYDIEVWMPGRGTFGEVTSTSNCRDFQSRRMNSKYIDENGGQQYIHTLNGTCMAVPRVILAIVENFYNKETNTISIPKVLQPFMNNKEYI
ncbi:related to Serine--tRNA ligase, mitochondrial [Saccharomycodes ludwigii]|uniref:serine--tRNA ligase n=1 Tax=Saccharomycodes ludwigii TaxID=36035 RepID=A0A376B9W3_9ASCO|nr:hypothetical protein SCDLUD_004903 [Saccharomycodes ludwigii]KAH3899459.1 hypothetical protein SCDLUD_004903 [Saccharomycodes ludwigii]SSD61466.1 related to Serine--tRNA ligase, mitochondrial [Saccharomycodes ludwigii]